MFCSKCGSAVATGAAFCSSCGQPIPALAAAGSVPIAAAATFPTAAPAFPRSAAASNVLYAGFWLRFVAWVIDRIVLWVAGTIVMLPFAASLGLRGMMRGRPPFTDPADVIAFMGTFFWLIVIAIALDWLYFAGFESSAWQATLGKKALGLEVTDLGGQRISFGRASGRFFGKIISNLTLLIGYILAGFTEKKQALHDMIAGTLVTRKA